ncbi:TonB-dependent receptor domain-containing protein [Helicobacter didelphidarum]|uniref:TonB-dependent receptor domain-containing protein n=1 Tax=Helicobacter didelphidarum TaxID=2040648 RepID=UPI0015F184B5
MPPPTNDTGFPSIGTMIEGNDKRPSKAHIYDVGGRILYNPNASNNLYLDISYAQQFYDNASQQIANHDIVASQYVVRRNNYILAHKGEYESFSMDNSIQFNQSWNDGMMKDSQTSRDLQGKDIVLESKSFVLLPADNLLTIGGSYWFAHMQDKVASPSKFSYHTLSLFAEDEWAALDNIIFTLGVREDWNSRFGFHTSPKAYVVYEAIPEWLTLKGGVSMGYKAPAMNMLIEGLYGSTRRGQAGLVGNPNLKPESSLSAELSIISDNDYFDLGATYFYNLFIDKISEVAINPANNANCTSFNSCYQAINIDKSYTQGLELFIGMKPLYGFGIDATYTFIDSQQLSGSMKGYPIANIANHIASFRLSYAYKDLGIYLRGEYQGKRFRNDSADRRAILGDYYKPYFLLHLGTNYKINKQLRLNFAIRNLLNQSFIDYRQYAWQSNNNDASASVDNTYNYIQEGRNYWVSVNMDF